MHTRDEIESMIDNNMSDVLYKGVDLSTPQWVLNEEAEKLFLHWNRLIDYYRDSTDSDIGLIFIGNYVSLRDNLTHLIAEDFDYNADMVITEEMKIKARRYLERIDSYLDKIMEEARRNYYNSEDKLK